MEIYKNMNAMFDWTKDNFAVYSFNFNDQKEYLLDYFHHESKRSIDFFSMEQYVMDTQSALQIQMKWVEYFQYNFIQRNLCFFFK